MRVRRYIAGEGARSRTSEHMLVAVLVTLVIGAFSSVPILASRSVTQQAAQIPAISSVPEVSSQAPVMIEEPIAPAPSPQIVDLQPVLDTWIAQHPKQQWGIVVTSISGKEFKAQVNPDKQFRSASLYKLFLVQSLFSKYTLAEQQTTSIQVGGGTRSLAACVDVMLRLSDNPCGEAVAAKLGWTRVTKQLQAAGYSNTDFGNTDGLVTSAADTARYLEQLNGTMLDEQSKAVIMGYLQKQRWNQGIPAGCQGCIVANKTGDIASVKHDVAVVQYEGGSYVIAILSQGGSFKQIAALTAQIQAAITAAP